ncbi:nicotinamide riboside transporter PnuC [Mucilaginibacter sp. dw_454]|uniref:nicotinamide riboside transporter PnuC n=1 Tax=Mucilaginibacter sp. dw_454 TaxID=2720079 RepID=UPI001BD3AAD6|nr:nicotinamide riboside transporter PnuC [Mucilaginibacter sp. dw_454]
MTFIHDLQIWWQQQSLWEIVGVITGLLCVYLAAKNIIWNWPFAIISVTIYIFIFYEKNLFADMGLQVYFLVVNIYGWYFWSKAPASADRTPVKLITKKEVWISLIATVVFTLFLGSVLRYTTASFPYIDSFCAACSLVAQVLLARKVVENWLIWVFVDTIYVGIYIVKGLDATAFMYAIYIPIALMGYMDWYKKLDLKSRTS